MKILDVTSKNCSLSCFSQKRDVVGYFLPLFPPWRFGQDKFNADCQNLPLLGANPSFPWKNYLSQIPCHSLLRCGQDPVPAAGNWNFSTVSSGSWIGLPFAVPKNYPNNPPERVPARTLPSQSKQSNPSWGIVCSHSRGVSTGQPQAPGSPGMLAVVTGVTPALWSL